jgi:phage terminase large subunit
MFVRTTAINKLLAMRARKKVVQGGTWAGKTYGIIPMLINYAATHKNKVVTVTAETIPALKGGAIKDFKNVMRDTARWFEDRWNATDLFYTFGTGTKIEFKSFETVGKAQAAGKRDVLFVNEAPYIDYEIADALIGRTTEDVWIDYNPTSEFWAHTEILPNNDAEFLLLKYTDNEALPATILNELMLKLDKAYYDPAKSHTDASNIKSNYWANWCRVYIDGEIGSLQGTVFQFTQCGAIPLEAELLGYGLDWGYSNDPTAVSAVYRCDNELFIEELIYETKLTNAMISERLKAAGIKQQSGSTIIADSAEPKSIAELQLLGWDIEAAQKGKDSINHSIDTLQNFKINVLSSSLNLIKEFRSYRWETDASGKTTNKPIDKFNHLIDGIRYVALNRIGEATGVYSFS